MKTVFKSIHSSAFTLIELLTVLAIIAILASLMVAAFSYAGNAALEAKTRAEIKAIEAALEAYKRDNGGYPPLNQDAFNGIPTSEGYISHEWGFNCGKGNIGGGTPRIESSETKTETNECGWFNSHFIVRALGTNNPNKVYYDFKDKQLRSPKGKQVVPNKGSGDVVCLIDPMGNPYGYNPLNPVGNPGSFDLFSAGVRGRSYYPDCFTDTKKGGKAGDPQYEDIGNWSK